MDLLLGTGVLEQGILPTERSGADHKSTERSGHINGKKLDELVVPVPGRSECRPKNSTNPT